MLEKAAVPYTATSDYAPQSRAPSEEDWEAAATAHATSNLAAQYDASPLLGSGFPTTQAASPPIPDGILDLSTGLVRFKGMMVVLGADEVKAIKRIIIWALQNELAKEVGDEAAPPVPSE